MAAMPSKQSNHQPQTEYDQLYQDCAFLEFHYLYIKHLVQTVGETPALLRRLEETELALAWANQACADWIVTHTGTPTRTPEGTE